MNTRFYAKNSTEVKNMNDTAELLKECNSGIKMGVGAIDDVLDKVSDGEFLEILSDSKRAHKKLASTAHEMLEKQGESTEEPPAMARGMSWIKTNVVLAADKSDKAVADLITNGCNMGVKSLNKYLNKYESADESAKQLAKDIISLETDLADNISKFL